MQKRSDRRQVLSAAELREAILAELVTIGFSDATEPGSLVFVGEGPRWHAALRPNGIRFDESKSAAIAQIARRLSDGYDLDPS
jgi:hypothetical protein